MDEEADVDEEADADLDAREWTDWPLLAVWGVGVAGGVAQVCVQLREA